MRSINRGWANRVRVARDGVEALDMLLGRDGVEQVLEPRLVLLDLKLPKMDGIAVPRQIRSNPKTRLVPAVLLISSVQERDIIESYELGVNS
jgi:two-component system, response regulator